MSEKTKSSEDDVAQDTYVVALLAAALGGTTFFAIWGVVSTLITGLIVSQLWNWFVVDFFKTPGMSVPLAIALSALVKYLTYTADFSNADTRKLTEKIVTTVARTLVNAAATYGAGWVIFTFFMY